MMVPSGVITQYVPFKAETSVGADVTGLVSAGFTVWRQRGDQAAAVMTTPTVAELDATNFPGAYRLLLDEDTTLPAGIDAQVMLLRITHASMAAVEGGVLIYRPKATIGETLTVSSGAVAIDPAGDDAVLAQVALVKAKTDSLTFGVASVLDVNITHVNDVAVTGVGTEANPWSPA